jgi:UPF0271 protein
LQFRDGARAVHTIDLNCDMGESFGPYRIGADADVVPFITSANLGCGFHGGDPRVMRESVALCKAHGVAIGAHPGFPDRLGFGRRTLGVTPEEVRDMVTYQVGALTAFAEVAGVKLRHVKPHGALYMMALEDDALASAIAESVAALDRRLAIFTTAGTAMHRAASHAGLRAVSEFFADRPMTSSGWRMFGWKLEEVGASVEAIAQRATRAVTEGKVRTLEGDDRAVEVETICVHSDTPGAAEIVRAVRTALETAGVRVGSPPIQT